MQRIYDDKSAISDVLKYLQAIVLIILLLYFGKGLFITMFFGLLIAMVMYPVCKWLEVKGFYKSIAIFICLAIVIMLFTAIILLLGWQIDLFKQDMPELTVKLKTMLPGFQLWIKNNTSITADMQLNWFRKTTENLSANAGTVVQSTLNATANALFSLFLIPIYAALFLYNRGTFVRFLYKVIGSRYRVKIDIILKETIHTYFNYIKGMVMVYIIVGILNSIGLLALGIKHAILFGMLTAIMTIIPYIGIIVSASLPIAMAFIMKDSIWYPIGVVAVFSFVQYLEANVIFPKVVGTQLNVSTWATLVAIIAGGIIWGVSGMVLFIPFVAIIKIVTDHIKELEAINILVNRDK